MIRVVVFGAGGVGGYFGARLAQAGVDVTFIARGKHLAAMREKGLHLDSELGHYTVQPAQATDNPSEVGTVDYVIVATKAWQVADAAEQIKPLVGEQTTVVPLLNGVEAPQQLADVLGNQAVIGGYCRVLSYIAEPGMIRQAGVPPYVSFGEMDRSSSERVARLQELFTSANIIAEVPEDIQAAMWQKLVFIASFGGVGAVTRSPAGIMRTVPETRAMIDAAIREVGEVARGRGIEMPADSVEKAMGYVDRLPEGATASMQRDILEGRPSELEAQNGAVVRLGEAVGVAAPTHQFIYHALLPAERQARGELDFERL